MRKSVNILFLVYICFVAVKPCVDKFDECESIEIAFNIENECQQNDNHDHSKDACSPICMCDCCSSLLITEKIFSFDSYINSVELELTPAEKIRFNSLTPFTPPPKS